MQNVVINWKVELDQESSYFTIFNPLFGRSRFLCMPFGFKMLQDVFQEKIDHTFEGCESTIGIADDIVIFGKYTGARSSASWYAKKT